jgi:glutathione S-transferase
MILAMRRTLVLLFSLQLASYCKAAKSAFTNIKTRQSLFLMRQQNIGNVQHRPFGVQSSLRKSSTTLRMINAEALTLYGHSGTRSPLINWACLELSIDMAMASDLSKNPHPFGQLPCLTDKGNVVVFESGAILQYLHENYNHAMTLSKAQSAAITSWIVWANASLDPVCFLETPSGKVYDTGLREPNRRMDQLNTILSKQSYLVLSSSIDNGIDESMFTMADVAIVSYLAYVLQFFSGCNYL